jgi:hypothetical protein
VSSVDRLVSYDGCPRCNAGLEATTGCCFEADDLRAGITRAENDLAEARAVARQLLDQCERYRSTGADQWRLDYPWLTETD